MRPLSNPKQLPLLQSSGIGSPSVSSVCGVAVSTMLPTLLAVVLGLADTRPRWLPCAVAGASLRA